MRVQRTAKARFRPQVEVLEAREMPAVYTVAASGGSDANNGTSAPWATLQHAANVVQPGDTVVVETGTYKGFDLSVGGTAGHPITFEAAPGATVTINSPEAKRGKDGINLEDVINYSAPVNYVTIQGLTVNNPAGGSITEAGIRAVWNGSLNSTGIILNGNTCNNCGEWGIFTSHEDNLLIENNTCSNAQQQHGIYVSNACFYPVVKDNVLFGNGSCGLHMNGDASQGPAGEPDGTSDGNNGNIIGALVEGNIIYNNGTLGGSGINGDGLQNSVIENNLLYNNHASGISLFQIDAALPATNNVVVNNTIIMASDGRWCVNIQDGSTGNTVFNNILLNNNAAHGSISISTDSLPGFVSNDNVITTNASAFDQVDASGNDNFMSFATWQGTSFPGTGQDKNSFTATAAQLFVNAGANNYQLAAGSPAIDKGVASLNGKPAPSTDLAANPRPSGNGFDIGAYEYQVAGGNLPPSITSGPNAAPNPVTGTTTALTVRATDADGDTLTYTWSVHGGPAAVGFSPNGTGAAGSTTATFQAAGSYLLQVTVTDSAGLSTSQTVGVTVQQTPTGIVVKPASITIPDGQTEQFTASEVDQFGAALAAQPTSAWGLAGSGGINAATGLYTAPLFGTSTATVTASANGFRANATVTVVIAPHNQFVYNVYEKLLGRAPDPGAVAWINLLNSGAAPSVVVAGIEQSTEYLTGLVASLYQHYLHRAADPGAAGWVRLLAGGISVEQVTASILSSPEYYGLHGGTDLGFVQALYQDVLNRAPDGGGLNAWLTLLAGGDSRYQVAWGFLISTEYRADLAESDYTTYLGRNADAGGLSGWVQALQAGLSDQALLAAIFGSAEGYAKWS